MYSFVSGSFFFFFLLLNVFKKVSLLGEVKMILFHCCVLFSCLCKSLTINPFYYSWVVFILGLLEIIILSESHIFPKEHTNDKTKGHSVSCLPSSPIFQSFTFHWTYSYRKGNNQRTLGIHLLSGLHCVFQYFYYLDTVQVYLFKYAKCRKSNVNLFFI